LERLVRFCDEDRRAGHFRGAAAAENTDLLIGRVYYFRISPLYWYFASTRNF
jgi:hypothetical protein